MYHNSGVKLTPEVMRLIDSYHLHQRAGEEMAILEAEKRRMITFWSMLRQPITHVIASFVLRLSDDAYVFSVSVWRHCNENDADLNDADLIRRPFARKMINECYLHFSGDMDLSICMKYCE